VLKLDELKYSIVKELVAGAADVDELAARLGKRKEELMRPLAELERLGLVDRVEEVSESWTLSETGQRYLKEKLPEERLLELAEGGELSLSAVKEKLGDEAGIAIGVARGLGAKIENGLLKVDPEALRKEAEEVRRCLESPDEECARKYKRRGFFKKVKVKRIVVRATPELLKAWEEGRILKARTITALTEEDIIKGIWKDAEFKEFDLSVEFPIRYPKRRHPLMEIHEYVKEILVSMGFEEVRGNYVDYALWNFDVLLVPQFHPARSETDVFYVSGARLPEPEEDVMKRAEKEHLRMWGFWRAEIARRLLLRTHTTVVTARTLYERGGGEYRVFSLDRVFRSETLDPTHSMEFHQLEGIIVGKEVSFKHLLGFFKEFAKKMGLGEVFFKPAYFPFTEPSVEGFIRHPEVGWIEVFPGGMFRPEMLRVVGLEGYNVAAWGIGIDRIAMMLLGLKDIRDLYTNDLSVIRKIRIPKTLRR